MDLRAFYDLMLLNGLQPGPYEAWRLMFAHNTEIWPIQREGQVIGGVLFRGHTVHIVVHPDWHSRWATKGMMRAVKTWAHDVPITAMIGRDNQPSIRLAEHIGFKHASDQGIYQQYVKEPTC